MDDSSSKTGFLCLISLKLLCRYAKCKSLLSIFYIYFQLLFITFSKIITIKNPQIYLQKTTFVSKTCKTYLAFFKFFI